MNEDVELRADGRWYATGPSDLCFGHAKKDWAVRCAAEWEKGHGPQKKDIQ